MENDRGFAENAADYDGTLEMTEASHAKTDVDAIDPNSLMVEIEGIHAAPFATRNYTRYTAKCLKNSIASWTHPYRRPLLKHHNEENGEPIGKIVAAEYMSRNTRSGTPAIKFTVNVPDEDAKKRIKNGLLSTTSIGVIAHDVRCSICGSPITDAKKGCPKGHHRGAAYDGKTCYWDIHDMEAKELSYVNVPSDMYAKNVDIYPAQEPESSNQPQIKESLDMNTGKGEQEQMAEPNKPTELEEAKAKVSELQSKVTELEEAKKSSEGKVAELTEANNKLTAQVAELQESINGLNAAAEEAKQLKESMEKEIADAKAEVKESLAGQYVALREALGHKVDDMEKIKSRSTESLKDSIMDMRESLNSAKDKAPEEKPEPPKGDLDTKESAGRVKDPTLNDGKDEKASKKKKQVSLREAAMDIFSGVMSARS